MQPEVFPGQGILRISDFKKSWQEYEKGRAVEEKLRGTEGTTYMETIPSKNFLLGCFRRTQGLIEELLTLQLPTQYLCHQGAPILVVCPCLCVHEP
jgi:hypothetical protein